MKQCNILFKSVAEGVSSNYKVKGNFNLEGNAFQISFYLNEQNEIQKYVFTSLKDGSLRLTKSGNSNYSFIFKNESAFDTKIDLGGYVISASIKTTQLETKILNNKITINCNYVLTIGGGDSYNSFCVELMEI